MKTEKEIEEELSKVFDSMSMMDLHSRRVFARYPQLTKAVASNLSEERLRVHAVLFKSRNFDILPGRDDMVARANDQT